MRDRVVAALRTIVGVDELLLTVALILVTVALWPHLGVTALLVPGLALLWIALPVRRVFIERPMVPDQKRRQM